MPCPGKEAMPGWGTKLDAAPHSGLDRPDEIAKPVRSYPGGGQGNVRTIAPCFARIASAVSLSGVAQGH